MLQSKLLRSRPMHANQGGSHRSENVRFTLLVSAPGLSVFVSLVPACVVVGVEKRFNLEKGPFFAAGASQSGVSWILLAIVGWRYGYLGDREHGDKRVKRV